MPNNAFFLPTSLEKAKNMPNYDAHTKHFLMPNDFK